MQNYLHHYTSFDGLHGIVKSDCLWATDAFTSNDKSELRHGIFLLEKFLVQKKCDTKSVRKLLSFFWKTTDVLSKGVFVLSLSRAKNEYSAENGLLSQWRGYGNFLIKFGIEEFKNVLSDHEEKNKSKMIVVLDGNLDEIGYFDDNGEHAGGGKEYKKYFDEHLKELLASAKLGEGFPNQTEEKIQAALRNFFAVMSMSKHYGFEEEKECRIANIVWKNSDVKVGFCEKNKQPRSYIELFSGQVKDLIKEVVIGPMASQLSVKNNIEILLRQNKIEGCEVKISKTPYIGS